MKYDGKQIASEKLQELGKSVKKHDVTPKLVSFVVGNSEGAMKYQKMKQKTAGEVGCELVIETVSSRAKADEITTKIKKLNTDSTVHGIMVQLPLPFAFSDRQKQTIIDTIDPFKDVDCMRDESVYVAPVVMAVEEALNAGLKTTGIKNPEILVVGSRGFVGSKIFTRLKQLGFKKIKGVDVDTPNWHKRSVHADILVSAVGKANLIGPNMVKEGAILIDVGAPKSDFAESCYKKCEFYTPVPGGIGPMTIYFLMENLVKSVQ